jgi:hypothetical protein
MGEMTIPAEVDWRSEPWGIDTPWAYKHFFGKNLAEAFDLFVENAMHYQEDIMFMPLACFKYYNVPDIAACDFFTVPTVDVDTRIGF